MAFEVSITLNGEARVVTIDPDDLPLAFFEDVEAAQESGKFAPIIRAYGAALGLTEAERRALRVRDFKALTAAIAQAVNVPLASA